MNREINPNPSTNPDLADRHELPKEQSVTIPVIEEQAQIGKKVVETGRVQLSKRIYDQDVTLDVPAVHEEVDVERVPINQYVETAPPAVRYEGDVMIVPVLREEVVVQKRLVLVEELRVTRRQVVTHETQQVTLRKEEVTVHRDEANLPGPGETGK